MARHRFLLGAALLALAAAPLQAQRVQDWQYKWYWGVKAGMIGYSLPTSGQTFAPSLGADWLITERHVALYIGYEQSFTAEQDTFQIQNLAGTQTVAFDGYRQIQINVVAFIGSKAIQPYVGGGFVLATLTNARDPNNASNATVNTAIDDAASGGFIQVMGGAQFRFGKKAAVYAQYSYTPQGRDFLLAGGGHTVSGGIRYAFLASKETDPTTRR
jgi:opacity protein-like surface antigen